MIDNMTALERLAPHAPPKPDRDERLRWLVVALLVALLFYLGMGSLQLREDNDRLRSTVCGHYVAQHRGCC